MNSTKEPEETKNTIIDLIVDLKDNIFYKTNEKQDLIVVEFFFRRLNANEIISYVTSEIIPLKSKIQERDVNFFIENKYLFIGLPESKVEYYTSIIVNSDRLTTEDREVIWNYFDLLIALSESYTKNK